MQGHAKKAKELLDEVNKELEASGRRGGNKNKGNNQGVFAAAVV